MTTHRPFLQKLVISSVLFGLSTGFASAQDINAVGERLKTILSNQGAELAWTGVSGSASEMLLDGVTISVTGQPKPLALGKVTLSNITEENGGYTIGKLALQDYSITEDGATVTINGVTMAGMKLPPDGSTDPLANMLMYDTADMGNLTVNVGGKDAFKMSGLHVEVTPPADGSAMEFTGAAESFTADLSSTADPQAKAVIDALGYQTLNGSFEMAGSWQPTDGRMALSQYDITVDEAGTLGMTFDLGGYTLDFVKSMQELQKTMASQPAGADNSAQGMAMLGLLQQLSFNAASVRFDDDSLTGKALDFIAKSQGMKASDIANQAKGLMPLMLAQVITDQALIASVTAAVSTYLDDPKSIEIVAAPAQPVPFALIIAGAMSAPQELPKTLGVTVQANQD